MVTNPVAAQPIRLVLLHHAGGSRLLYRGWERRLPASWEVLTLDAPGRGFHHDLPPLDEFESMVDFVQKHALDGLNRPLAVFGHSMGAAVATGLASRLLAGAGPTPVWLGLSGWAAQRLGEVNPSGLSTDDLRARVRQLGGMPDSLLADPDLWHMVEPLLRKDLTVVGSHDPTLDRSWLKVALSLFGGHSDVVVSPKQLADVAAAAHRLIGLHLYAGNHFYLNDHASLVVRQIVADIRAALVAGHDDAMTSTKGI